MDFSPVILSIPIFFTLMALELVFEAFTKKKTYRLNDAITNINLGALDQITGTFLKVVKVGLYVLTFEYLALFQIEANWLSFITLFILYDLCYYWSHRMAHTVSLFWGGHVVHHQSEDFNLSVALRQSSTSLFWSIPFYLPLAVIGFDPTQLVLVAGFNLLYQFWIHTEHIGKMGWMVEGIMNTPSHHRVHHGRDPKYIDKNYAGVFIIWDRMFGTFKEEEERPNYGITKPLKSWNPVYANVAHYIDLFGHVKKARNVKDGLKMLFYKPGWQPNYLGGYQGPQPVSEGYDKYNADPPVSGLKAYILVQFLAASGVNAFYLFNFSKFAPLTKGLYAVWIIVAAVMFGILFESRRRWISWLEGLRLLCIPLGMWALQQQGLGITDWMIAAGAAFVLGSLAVYWRLQRRFLQVRLG